MTQIMFSMEKSTSQDYLKFIPAAYAYLILLSYIKLHVYYYYFGIEISNYIEITELLITSIFDFITFLAVMTSTLLIYIPLLSLIWLNRLFKNKNKDSYTKKVKIIILIFYTTVIEVFVVIGYELWTKTLNGELDVIIFLLPILASILIYPIIIYNKLPIVRTAILTMLFLLATAIWDSQEKVSTALDFGSTKEITKEIEYNGKLIKREYIRDGSGQFIGKTKNYIFYHKADTTTVFPRKDVGYIKLKTFIGDEY